jgi:hypothetical protein
MYYKLLDRSIRPRLIFSEHSICLALYLLKCAEFMCVTPFKTERDRHKERDGVSWFVCPTTGLPLIFTRLGHFFFRMWSMIDISVFYRFLSVQIILCTCPNLLMLKLNCSSVFFPAPPVYLFVFKVKGSLHCLRIDYDVVF